MNALTLAMISEYRRGFESDAFAQTLNAAASKTDLNDLAFIPINAAKLNGDFEIELKTRGITAQQRSGRCWLFAAMNIIREIVAERCGLDGFELSGNYLAFFDKLEKANNFLEMVIANGDKPKNARINEYILDGFGDGGYWTMAVDLIQKYGVVPKSVMPESFQSEHTERFMKLLNGLLRKDAAELRAFVEAGKDPQQRKQEMMAEIFKAECIVFGEPPESFDFSYRNQNGEFHVDRSITPKAFYEKYIGLALDDYVTVTNHPTSGLKTDLHYKFHYIGSMAESDITSLNLSMDELEDLCLKQLRDGEPIWFGCDSGAYGSRKDGVWDPDSLDYKGLLGNADPWMNKGDRLEYHASYATHAMILVGVSFDPNGKPCRWKIENSWGDDVGNKGYFVCSEKYFREYVYEAIIHKKHLNEHQLAVLASEPIEINAWESDTL